MRVLFAPFGSEGDVSPLLWLAGGLAARGHETLCLLNPHYGRLADKRGLPWLAMGTEEDFLRVARDPLLWHPEKGPETVFQLMLESLSHYRDAFNQAGGKFDLVVTSSFALAAAAMAELAGTPHLSLHFQPVALRSAYDCPLFHPRLGWVCRSPHWVKRLFFRFVDLFFWERVRRPLNAFRRELGLPPWRAFFDEAIHGHYGAALFPEWFAAPQPDWPAKLRQFNFPVARDRHPLPATVEQFLAAGEPPLIWTHGSANFDIAHFQARALDVSARLGQRCLLVSLDPPARPLPPQAFHAPYARFEDLFPRGRAVVHHGGIGTTAKCIAAGVPQLIVPRSHDQPDNARRIARLGLGGTLTYPRLDSPALENMLRALLDDDAMARRGREYQARLLADDPLPGLCAYAEAIAAR